MKTNKMCYLDVDLVSAINEPLSPLLNKLLAEHIDQNSIMSMNIEELRAEKACQELEQATKAKLKELRENARHK